MHTSLASRLTARQDLHGRHLQVYLQKRKVIQQSLIEELVLHDRIFIPTPDFLTACGMHRILGEYNFIELLEAGKIHFIRTQGILTYGRGTGPDGQVLVMRSEGKAQDCPLDQSIRSGLSAATHKIADKVKLARLLEQNSTNIDWLEILEQVRLESFSDLKQTPLWKPEYEFENPDLLALPVPKEMQFKILGDGLRPESNIVDALLEIVSMNSDLFLSEKFHCTNTSPRYTPGDLIHLKCARASIKPENMSKLWEILEVGGIADFGLIEIEKKRIFKPFMKAICSRDADQFRDWFHSSSNLSESEIVKEYAKLLGEVPTVGSLEVPPITVAVSVRV